MRALLAFVAEGMVRATVILFEVSITLAALVAEVDMAASFG